MSVPTTIVGYAEGGGQHQVAVLHSGAMAVSGFEDAPFSAALTVDDAVVEVVETQDGRDIIVTGVIVTTSRNVGANGATVDIYFAKDPTSSDTSNAILPLVDVAKNSVVTGIPLNIRVPVGNFILAKTDDNEVNITVYCHYVETESD